MPRAKRTNRAEARRRHRAALAEQPAQEGLEASEASTASGEPAAARSAGGAPARPSLSYAFRAAFRPVNLREDLLAVPRLLVDRSVWLPCLLTVVAGAAFAVTEGQNWLVNIAATYFVAPPALGSVFIAGFLAPRASYLVGFVVGLFSAVVASVLILTSPASLVTGEPIGTTALPSPAASLAATATGSPAASPAASAVPSSPGPSAAPIPSAAPSPTPPPPSLQDQIVYAFVTSPPFGMFFAASAAWYRRFLRLSRPTTRSQQRRSDGRTRSNPNQKPRR